MKNLKNKLNSDLIQINLNGSAGQSLELLSKSISLKIFGDANDYVVQRIIHGKIVVVPSKINRLKTKENTNYRKLQFYIELHRANYLQLVKQEKGLLFVILEELR